MSEALGYAASLAVLATFLMRSMVSLRLVAILSNILFVTYGYFSHVQPVLLLHLALLPINVARLTAPQNQAAIKAFAQNASGERGRQLALFLLGMSRARLGFARVFRFAHPFSRPMRP